MEALIFTIDVVCMVYLCWRFFRSDRDRPDPKDLGWFAPREDRDA